MNDCIQEPTLRCMQVPSIIAVAPVVNEKQHKQLALRKSPDRELQVISDPVSNLT